MCNKHSFSDVLKIPEFLYLCDRNADRVMLEGLGIRSPLLLTQSGIFINKSSFFQDGSIFVDFYRDTFIDIASNIIAPPSFGLDWDIIKLNIKNNSPVIILVDVYFMPYKKIHYQTNHAAHCVILNDISDDGYLVVDWYEPDYYTGVIDEDTLNLARQSINNEDGSSVFSGYPINSAYKTINIKSIKSFNYTIEACVHINFKNMLEKLKNGHTVEFFNNINDNIPIWIQEYDELHYFNAVKSFFFFELELNIFIRYLEEIQITTLKTKINHLIIKNNTMQLKTAVIILKNKFHRAIRKRVVLDINSWNNFKTILFSYYNQILKLIGEESKL